MSSPAQIDTSRINGRNSHGPSSAEGKAITRFNAMKHGLDAASLVIPGEDPAEFTQLAEAFHRELCPWGVLETELVETLIRSTWFQHRYARLEAQLLKTILNTMDDPATATIGEAYYKDATGPNAMGKLFRRQRAAQRDSDNALAELRRLQQMRVEMQMLRPAPALAPKPPVPVPVPKPAAVDPRVGSEPPLRRP